jgi:glycosyltransferase involved in cell wall biosynthesis
LPVPNNIAVVPDTAAVNRIRRLYLPGQNLLLGHFGTYGVTIRILLEKVLPLILSRHEDVALVLIGNGSVEFRERLVAKVPWLADRVHATGPLSGADVSQHLLACDLMLQPYPDGITTRRTSAMAALAHGVPLVSTVGELTEKFWTQSEAVNVVPAHDENALSQAVSRLIDDPGERNRLSVRSRELYSEKFDVQHLIAALRGQN